MEGIVPKLKFSSKQKLYKHMKKCKNYLMKQRYLIVINLVNNHTPTHIARVLHISRETVYRVAKRFRNFGEAGLMDLREDNGQLKLDDTYLNVLYEVVKSSPQNYGWKRPTWTREMLVQTLREKTGVSIHPSTMSRALRMIHARRGRPKAVVFCPWTKTARTRRMNAIRRLVASLPKGHVALYEDEVDVHLNPKIGLDWMVRGQQKQVVTPGKNVKRYLAGALETSTKRMFWVSGQHKNSALFIELIQKRLHYYGPHVTIHIILDNYRIHTSQISQKAISSYNGKVVLHFLPPYCPDENRIERVWQDLHSNVTRNHRCDSIDELMKNVFCWLCRYNRCNIKHSLKKTG